MLCLNCKTKIKIAYNDLCFDCYKSQKTEKTEKERSIGKMKQVIA